MDDLIWPVWIPIVAILGWVVVSVVNSISRARVREMEVRERIAMIERGLVPAPEVDPAGFDRAMDRYDRMRYRADRRTSRAHGRYRRAGVTLLGVGFGLMLMLGFLTGEPRIGLGVGGFLAILGLAFFLNSLFESSRPETDWYSSSGPRMPPPSPGSSGSSSSIAASRPPSN
ncbi:MAG TPA: hypothetical protein VKH42_01850 [Vicinamibacterales bacterium]|nr:hypothetical protein [Vicinamibacterales bacterium]